MSDDMLTPQVRARLSIQRALLTHVTPSLRSVSLSVREDGTSLDLQFVYDRTRTDDELQLPHIVAAEVAGDWHDPLAVREVVLTIPAPDTIAHLDWIVYGRCEDGWVEVGG